MTDKKEILVIFESGLWEVINTYPEGYTVFDDYDVIEGSVAIGLEINPRETIEQGSMNNILIYYILTKDGDYYSIQTLLSVCNNIIVSETTMKFYVKKEDNTPQLKITAPSEHILKSRTISKIIYSAISGKLNSKCYLFFDLLRPIIEYLKQTDFVCLLNLKDNTSKIMLKIKSIKEPVFNKNKMESDGFYYLVLRPSVARSLIHNSAQSHPPIAILHKCVIDQEAKTPIITTYEQDLPIKIDFHGNNYMLGAQTNSKTYLKLRCIESITFNSGNEARTHKNGEYAEPFNFYIDENKLIRGEYRKIFLDFYAYSKNISDLYEQLKDSVIEYQNKLEGLIRPLLTDLKKEENKND